MYYAHFGLKEPPFKITPNTDFFFSGGNRGAILDALIYAITSGEGIIKVVGEVGSGKTMLCRMLQALLPEQVESVYLANPSVAPEDVLHAIAFELQLGLPSDADRLRVMQVLQTYLLERHAEGRRVVIFIEEAQGMPLATLEEIRLLSNLETRHDKLLQIVLFGQPELDDNLNQTQIRQLRERITHSFNLGPLSEKDVAEYLIFRLRAAGYFGPHLFSRTAIRMIARSSGGLVRRINILADKALLAAFSENQYQVIPRHVKAAIRDSEFGAEQLKRNDIRKVVLGAVAILLSGLALGYLLNLWLHRDTGPEQAKPVAADVQQPVTEPSQPAEADRIKEEEAGTHAEMPVGTAAAQAVTSDDLLERRLVMTLQWLNQQPETTVSIQLMGGANDAQLRRQLETLAQEMELDNLYVYRTRVNNAPYLTVLYGSYESRQAAQQAMRQLPEALRSYRPQLRTVGGVLQEIKQFQ
ncbi:MAG TPA: AAA family ATPase [Methylophilaceae bacterium]|jgi:MSHA biogenesis protein MshM